jgi:hypothetical protein
MPCVRIDYLSVATKETKTTSRSMVRQELYLCTCTGACIPNQFLTVSTLMQPSNHQRAVPCTHCRTRLQLNHSLAANVKQIAGTAGRSSGCYSNRQG